MARAAWAIVVPGDGGGAWAGPAQGPQTARRGELYAAVAAAGAVPDGVGPSEWKHADLRARVRNRA
eukprot:7768676-Lingulodinium_polyedra.AAC.1